MFALNAAIVEASTIIVSCAMPQFSGRRSKRSFICHMPLYSIMIRDAAALRPHRIILPCVSSDWSSTFWIVTLLIEKREGTSSSSPSSHRMTSVRCPSLKPGSSSIDCKNVVLPASRKPVNKKTGSIMALTP